MLHATRCLLCLVLLPLAVNGESKLEDQRDYQTARQALSDGLFEVAAVKAKRLLSQPSWSAKQKSTLAALEVEALVRAEQGYEALEVLKAQNFDNHDYWQGLAFLLTGAYDDASAVLAKAITTSTGDLKTWATIARSHALLGDGRESTARTRIKPLRDHPDPAISRHARMFFNELETGPQAQSVLLRLARERGEKDATVQYLRARSLFQLDDLKKAEDVLRDLLQTESIRKGPQMHDAAIVLLAEVMWKQRLPTASSSVVAFLNSFTTAADGRTDTDYWSEAFGLLERIALESKPSETLLTPAIAWASDSMIPERQGYALYFIASELHRAGRDSEATGIIESLIQSQPRHPRISDAIRLAMQLHGITRNDTRVLQLAERWKQDFGGGGKAVVDFLVGLIHFMRGDYRDALSSFNKAADGETDIARRRRALYNAAICAIKTGQKTLLKSVVAQLTQASIPDPNRKPGSPPLQDTAADLELDKALQFASKLDPGAENELNNFIKRHPTSVRLAEALVSLAEFRLLDLPPRAKEAAEALDAATAANPSPLLREQIGYVRVWLSEARQDLPGITVQAANFLATWPESKRADEVRMKLAETYYRQEKYALARTEFEILATHQADSAYADAALYFAGMSAMAVPTQEGLNAAISTWDDLIQRGGPLAFAARQQQAIATRKQGNIDKALKIYESLLTAPEATGDQRLSLQYEKAELLITLGKSDAPRYEEAVTLLRSMLATDALPYGWSARCGVLMATTLRDMGRPAEALEACYDVINVGTNVVTAPQNPSEYQWFYRAGFIAVDLLETAQRWEAAATVAERLAQTSGDRAKDAAERASKIRLKHFLWDGEK